MLHEAILARFKVEIESGVGQANPAPDGARLAKNTNVLPRREVLGAERVASVKVALRSEDFASRLNSTSHRAAQSIQSLLNSIFRFESWFCSRWTMLECIWLTRLSLRFNVAPISFIVISS